MYTQGKCRIPKHDFASKTELLRVERASSACQKTLLSWTLLKAIQGCMY